MTRLLVLAALLAASPAGAVPRNTVKAHIDKATQAHKDGKFDVALAELQAAYVLDPKPDLLFAIAQVYVKLDKCADAIVYYERFLAATKDAQAKTVVAQAIDTCKTKLASTEPTPTPTPTPEPIADPIPDPVPEPKPEPPPTVVKPPPEPPSPPTVQRSSAWYKDPVGGALVGGGVVAGVVAIVLRSGAQSEADKANAPGTTEVAYRDHVDRADSKETIALVVGVTAGALITAGVVRYVTRGTKREPVRLGVAPASDGGLVTVIGRF